LAQAAAMATKAGTPFSTPMPQIPQSVIEEMQKKQAMDAAKKPTASLQEQLQEAAAAASGPSERRMEQEQQLLLGLFLKQILQQ